jgi:hypothetical protein
VLHGYECVVALINVFQSAWDDDDFSWDWKKFLKNVYTFPWNCIY